MWEIKNIHQYISTKRIMSYVLYKFGKVHPNSPNDPDYALLITEIRPKILVQDNDNLESYEFESVAEAAASLKIPLDALYRLSKGIAVQKYPNHVVIKNTPHIFYNFRGRAYKASTLAEIMQETGLSREKIVKAFDKYHQSNRIDQ